jgi:ribose 5-phosphate isomerase
MLLAARLEAIPGVLGHGLFLGLASVAMVGTRSGVRLIEASAPA